MSLCGKESERKRQAKEKRNSAGLRKENERKSWWWRSKGEAKKIAWLPLLEFDSLSITHSFHFSLCRKPPEFLLFESATMTSMTLRMPAARYGSARKFPRAGRDRALKEKDYRRRRRRLSSRRRFFFVSLSLSCHLFRRLYPLRSLFRQNPRRSRRKDLHTLRSTPRIGAITETKEAHAYLINRTLFFLRRLAAPSSRKSATVAAPRRAPVVSVRAQVR